MLELEIFPPQMYKVKNIVSAGFSSLEKNDGVSMQVSWESCNNEHTTQTTTSWTGTLQNFLEDSAKPTKGWWFDKGVSKTRDVGWSALSEDDLSTNQTAPDSCSETAPHRAKRFWRSCSTSTSCISGRNFFGEKKKNCVLRVETIFI